MATKSINSKEFKLFTASLRRPAMGELCRRSVVTRFVSTIHLLSRCSKRCSRLFALKLPERQQLDAHGNFDRTFEPDLRACNTLEPLLRANVLLEARCAFREELGSHTRGD